MWYPRKLVVLKQSGRYAVCDRGNERSRMQIFARNGQFIRKVAIRFIEILAGLAVTNEGASSLFAPHSHAIIKLYPYSTRLDN